MTSLTVGSIILSGPGPIPDTTSALSSGAAATIGVMEFCAVVLFLCVVFRLVVRR